jgi:hypothetical protein
MRNKRHWLFIAVALGAAFVCPERSIMAESVGLSGQEGPQCTSSVQINQTTGTDLKTFTNTGYICFVLMVTATTQNLNLVTGTGSVCASGTAGLLGGTTAATGLNLAANGGFSSGTGLVPIMKAASSAQHLCLLQSGSGQVSGTILYSDQ